MLHIQEISKIAKLIRPINTLGLVWPNLNHKLFIMKNFQPHIHHVPHELEHVINIKSKSMGAIHNENKTENKLNYNKNNAIVLYLN